MSQSRGSYNSTRAPGLAALAGVPEGTACAAAKLQRVPCRASVFFSKVRGPFPAVLVTNFPGAVLLLTCVHACLKRGGEPTHESPQTNDMHSLREVSHVRSITRFPRKLRHIRFAAAPTGYQESPPMLMWEVSSLARHVPSLFVSGFPVSH